MKKNQGLYFSSPVNIYSKTQKFHFFQYPKEKDPVLLLWIQYVGSVVSFLTAEMREKAQEH